MTLPIVAYEVRIEYCNDHVLNHLYPTLPEALGEYIEVLWQAVLPLPLPAKHIRRVDLDMLDDFGGVIRHIDTDGFTFVCTHHRTPVRGGR